MKSINLMLGVIILIVAGLFQTQAQDNKSKEGVFLTVEEMPEYPGGEEAIKKDIAEAVNYPDDAKKKGIQGKVYVTFVVDEQGKVTDAKIARGVDPLLDKEALRVMGQLKTWKPGKEKGEAVKVSYTVPIKFALDDEKKEEK